MTEINKYISISDESPSGLVWHRSPRSNKTLTKFIIAGSISKRKYSDYYLIGFKRKVYYVHRLIYCLYHNIDYSTTGEIDHIDGNSLNNKISNLRLVLKSLNSLNKKKCKQIKSSKFKGVSYYTKYNKWTASLTKDKIKFRLGYFDSEIDAANAYNKKLSELTNNFLLSNNVIGI